MRPSERPNAGVKLANLTCVLCTDEQIKSAQSKQRALLPVALPIIVGIPSSKREVSVKTKPPIKTAKARPTSIPHSDSEVLFYVLRSKKCLCDPAPEWFERVVLGRLETLDFLLNDRF